MVVLGGNLVAFFMLPTMCKYNTDKAAAVYSDIVRYMLSRVPRNLHITPFLHDVSNKTYCPWKKESAVAIPNR